jgi:hypothetical protein
VRQGSAHAAQRNPHQPRVACAVAFEAPVIATVFGAAAFWLIGHGIYSTSPRKKLGPIGAPDPIFADPVHPTSNDRVKGCGRRRGSQGPRGRHLSMARILIRSRASGEAVLSTAGDAPLTPRAKPQFWPSP